MDAVCGERAVDDLARELDTIRLEEPLVSMPVDALHRALGMDITGWFAFDVHGGLAGFDVIGMSAMAATQYRRGVIRIDRPWEFFDPWAVPDPQRDRVVACQALEFLRGGAATRRRLGLSRTSYERVRRAFEQHSYAFYERHAYHRLWHLRAVISEGPRCVGWVGGLCDRPPTRVQRDRIAHLLPSILRRTRYLRAAASASSHGLVEAILERLDRAAFVVDREGRIAHTNRRGLAALEEPHAADAVSAAGRRHASPRFEVVAVANPGVPTMSLVVDRRSDEHGCAMSRFGFTKRQADVAGTLCLGASNREIGERLRISERTVEVHLSAIYERLGVAQRAGAIACLLQATPRWS